MTKSHNVIRFDHPTESEQTEKGLMLEYLAQYSTQKTKLWFATKIHAVCVAFENMEEAGRAFQYIKDNS